MLTERFEMRFAPALVERIDKWRSSQPVPPSRAAAIRYLIEFALDITEGGDKARDLIKRAIDLSDQIPIRGRKTA